MANEVLHRQQDVPGLIGTSCPPINGRTPAQIAQLCDADPTCVGFNLLHFQDNPSSVPLYCLKNQSGPRTDHSTGYMKEACQGTYLRRDPGAWGEDATHSAVRVLNCASRVWGPWGVLTPCTSQGDVAGVLWNTHTRQGPYAHACIPTPARWHFLLPPLTGSLVIA